MNKEDLQKLISLRTDLIAEFNKLRDYKNNPNAIMKEKEFASSLNDTIKKIDEVLKEHVKIV